MLLCFIAAFGVHLGPAQSGQKAAPRGLSLSLALEPATATSCQLRLDSKIGSYSPRLMRAKFSMRAVAKQTIVTTLLMADSSTWKLCCRWPLAEPRPGLEGAPLAPSAAIISGFDQPVLSWPRSAVWAASGPSWRRRKPGGGKSVRWVKG